MPNPSMTRARVRILSLLTTKRPNPTIREMCAALSLSPNAIHETLRKARLAGVAETNGEPGGWRLTRHGAKVVRALSAAFRVVDEVKS